MKRGYVHLILEQVNEDGKTGGTIYPKAMWPQSTDFSTTVISSVSNNVTFGKGSSGKIGLDDGAEITYGDSSNASLSMAFTKSTVTDDPVLSAQYSSSSIMEAQWNFEVVNRNPVSKTTYAFDQYFMFEMKKDAKNCSEDAFIANYSVKFQGQYQGFMWFWYEGWEFSRTTRISCFM